MCGSRANRGQSCHWTHGPQRSYGLQEVNRSQRGQTTQQTQAAPVWILRVSWSSLGLDKWHCWLLSEKRLGKDLRIWSNNIRYLISLIFVISNSSQKSVHSHQEMHMQRLSNSTIVFLYAASFTFTLCHPDHCVTSRTDCKLLGTE